MDDDVDEQPDLDTLPAAEAPPPPVVPLAPQTAYREALRGYDGALLAALASAVGQLEPPRAGPRSPTGSPTVSASPASPSDCWPGCRWRRGWR